MNIIHSEMKTWKMRLICQGKNQNVKYVIRLKSPLHVRRDVNATPQVTDGHPFVSPIAKRVHKGYKFCTDVLRGCSVWSVQLKALLRYYHSAHRNFALLISQQELLVRIIRVNIEISGIVWNGLICIRKGLAFLVNIDRKLGSIRSQHWYLDF